MNVRTLCLGYLSLREATGYEIKRDFEEGLFCHFNEASYGSIYPALNQLAVEGLLTVREEEQSGKPDKKIYSITAVGLVALSKALAIVPGQDKYKSEFLFIMLLQHHISVAQQVEAIETQLAFLQADLDNIAQCRLETGDHAASNFVMGYGEAVLTAGVTYLMQKLSELKHSAQMAAE